MQPRIGSSWKLSPMLYQWKGDPVLFADKFRHSIKFSFHETRITQSETKMGLIRSDIVLQVLVVVPSPLAEA